MIPAWKVGQSHECPSLFFGAELVSWLSRTGKITDSCNWKRAPCNSLVAEFVVLVPPPKPVFTPVFVLTKVFCRIRRTFQTIYLMVLA
jgi:hypothetical protein